MARTVVITSQGIPGSAATGYSPGGTDVAVSDGGTGASSAAAARTNLGLGNVDNTSDVNKPVSTAQGVALAAKADDALVMKLAGTQTVTGLKRFTAFPEFLASAGGAMEGRSPGDGITVGKWDVVHNGDQADLLHITGGPNAGSVNNNGAYIALGVQYGGTGFFVNHYGDLSSGRDTVGFYVNNMATVTRANAFGFRGIQNSTTSRLMALSATVAGGATLLELATTQAMNAGTILQTWNVNGTQVGRVNADTGAELGKLVWGRTMETIAPSSGVTPILRVADENVAARTETYMGAKTNGETGLYIFRWSGSTTLMYAHRFSATTDRIKWEIGRGAQNKGSHTFDTMIEMQAHAAAGRMAFFGGTPRIKPSGWTQATGTATRTTFDTAVVTLPELAQRVKALIDDLHTTGGLGLIGA